MADRFLDTLAWRCLRARIVARDGNRCSIAALLGGDCAGDLHVHHIEPRSERPDLALDENNCASVCAVHHPQWEAVRLFLARARRPLPPCRHVHRYKAGKEACDRRRAARLGIVLAA